MRSFLLSLFLLLASAPAFAELTEETVRSGPHAEVEQALPNAHPSAYYHYAERLYEEGKREQALTWMYVGHIRYLLHLHSNPVGADEDAETFGRLTSAVVQPALRWAAADIDMLVARLDEALAWDADHPNGYTPRDSFKAQWEHARSDVQGQRNEFDQRRDFIRAERERAGLPND